jgi:hypothetical protein
LIPRHALFFEPYRPPARLFENAKEPEEPRQDFWGHFGPIFFLPKFHSYGTPESHGAILALRNISMSESLDTISLEQVRCRVLPDGRMTRDDAARYLGHKPKTLAMWQLQGKGPKSIKVAGRIFYFKDELDAFIRGEAA